MNDEVCEENTWNAFSLAVGRFCLDILVQNDASSQVLACIVEPGITSTINCGYEVMP